MTELTCDKIDFARGGYDPITGHSHFYGHGRLNAERAVKTAKRRHDTSDYA